MSLASPRVSITRRAAAINVKRKKGFFFNFIFVHFFAEDGLKMSSSGFWSLTSQQQHDDDDRPTGDPDQNVSTTCLWLFPQNNRLRSLVQVPPFHLHPVVGGPFGGKRQEQEDRTRQGFLFFFQFNLDNSRSKKNSFFKRHNERDNAHNE